MAFNQWENREIVDFAFNPWEEREIVDFAFNPWEEREIVDFAFNQWEEREIVDFAFNQWENREIVYTNWKDNLKVSRSIDLDYESLAQKFSAMKKYLIHVHLLLEIVLKCLQSYVKKNLFL